jgi:hypothetical protein
MRQARRAVHVRNLPSPPANMSETDRFSIHSGLNLEPGIIFTPYGAIMNAIKRITQSLLKLIKRVSQIAGRAGATKDAHSQRITRRVAHALALTPRGAVWNDVLAIDRLAIALHVEWFARDVHPWNDDLPERRRSELFAQQCLEDVDAAIPRLFEQLPEIDTLEIRVLERESKTQIITGVVQRSDLAIHVSSSLGMRLKTIGINYQRPNLILEPIA